MAKINLTDRFISSDKRKPLNGRMDYPDAQVPGLALRVTSAGHRSFVLIARFPLHPKNPTRRALGDLGAITLEQARAKARRWLELIGKGIDPAVEEARQRAEAQRRQVNTFAAVAGEFLDRHASGLAKAGEAKRIIDAEFVKRWAARPITDIRPEECAAAIRGIVKRGSPYQAHNALGYLKRLYSWAIGTNEFAVLSSPVASLRPTDLIGKREARDRVLADLELRAVWDAADGMGFPYGSLIRLLILTGQREREVADITWPEVDFDRALWTVPATRMKGAGAHEIPLAPEALALLRSLPRFTAGDHVFTTTAGSKAVNGFSKAKGRVDALSGVAGWKFHDLRRTMRTHLSALPIEDRVREQMIAHAQPGLHKVYDLHRYEAEKRRGFELWEQRLRGILNPALSDVTDIAAERDRRMAQIVA
jgi:integrase